MKFTTPTSISDYFYFNIDLRDIMTKLNDECEEVIGLSIGRLYIGFYGDSINWGILDEYGSLWQSEKCHRGGCIPPRFVLHYIR